MRSSIGALALVLGLVFSAPVSAHHYTDGAITIVHPTAGATPAGATTGAAFMQIVNGGTTAITIKSVSTPSADKVEIHEMVMVGGVMRMRTVDKALSIAPGQTLKLDKGELHLMLIGLKNRLVEEDVVPLSITFDNGEVVDVHLYVEPIAKAGAAIKDHDGH